MYFPAYFKSYSDPFCTLAPLLSVSPVKFQSIKYEVPALVGSAKSELQTTWILSGSLKLGVVFSLILPNLSSVQLISTTVSTTISTSSGIDKTIGAKATVTGSHPELSDIVIVLIVFKSKGSIWGITTVVLLEAVTYNPLFRLIVFIPPVDEPPEIWKVRLAKLPLQAASIRLSTTSTAVKGSGFLTSNR